MQRGSGIPARLRSGRGRQALALALLIACVAPAHAARPALAAIDSLWTAGQVDACWARLRDAIVETRATGDRAYLLDLLVRRGSWRARLGLVAEAEPDLREALDLTVRAGTGEPQRECLRWLGFALYRQGRALEARTCWNRLLRFSRAAGDREHAAWALAGVALQEWEAGRPRLALEPYQESLALFRACDDPRGAAYVQNGLGTVLQALGRYDEALAQYRRTVEAARALNWTWLEALAENNAATLLFSLGDPGRARAQFLRAAELHHAAGDAAEAALAGANVAKCEAALGRFEEAVGTLQRIGAECRERGIAQLDASLRNTLAGIRWEQGRFHLAARLHRETLAEGPALPAKARLVALLGLSRELAALDSVAAAVALLEQAAVWVAELDDPRYRLEHRIELGRRYLDAGRAAAALPLLAASAREAQALRLEDLRLPALAAAARAARARELPDTARALLSAAVASWEAERGLPADPEWREIRGQSAAEIRTQLGSLLLEYPPALSREERARAAFDAVQVFKARTLLERMLGPAGQGTPALAPVVASCGDLQHGTLRPGELLLDFHLGDDESLVFAVSPTECRAVRLPGARTFSDALALYERMMTTSAGSSPVTTATSAAEARERIRELLLGPVADLVAASRSITIAPDGLLYRTSFAVLLEDWPDLAHARVLQVIPSATILAELRRLPASPSAAQDHAGPILALAGETEATGRPLRGARAEVRDLAARYRHVQLALAPRAHPVPADSAGTASDVAAALEALRAYRRLHFASHATLEGERPWRSALKLRAGDPIDITAADIARSRLRARLVTLSTCRSADGRVLSGEGVQGLAGAFLVAGVPAVVATLWPVDDESTRRFMRRFYGHLANGDPIAEALARAQADLRRDPERRAPYHWAGFVVIGDGGLTVALERRPWAGRRVGPWVLIGAGVLALFGQPLVSRLRRRA